MRSCFFLAALAPVVVSQDQPAQDPWADAFTFERVAIPPGVDPQIGGIDEMPSGKLAMCFHRGEVFTYDPADGSWALFAEGLHEPLGLLVEDERSVLVMQRCELTRLVDQDGDGRADDYQSLYNTFGMSGNYHEFGFGPARDGEGYLYVALGTASNGAGVRPEIRGAWSDLGVERERMLSGKGWGKVKVAAGRMYSRVPWRGWVMRLSPDGKEVTPFASGFRTPDGIGFDAEGRLLVADNQGDWLGTSKVHHVREGGFYGHPASLVWREGWDRAALDVPVEELEGLRTPAMALLPQGEIANSPTQPVPVPAGVFGPLAGQTLIGEMNQQSLVRLLPDCVGGISQAAAVPFLRSEQLGRGNHRMVFTEDGSLWVAKTHLSWAGSDGLVRVRWKGPEHGLFAVANVQLQANGFNLAFTEPVDQASLQKITVRSHSYRYHRAYGSPKVDERQETTGEPTPDAKGLSVRVQLAAPPTAQVYTIDLSTVRSRTGRRVLGDKVYYTVVVPR
jgi:hypothetical protein